MEFRIFKEEIILIFRSGPYTVMLTDTISGHYFSKGSAVYLHVEPHSSVIMVQTAETSQRM